MSVFRVEKNKNYTVLSNYHLRDKNLSLRSIGLLSLILSLPENWDYTTAGLAAICKDGQDSITTGLKELEKFGYLERERERDAQGRVKGTIFRIYETPKDKRETVPEQPKTSENKGNSPNREFPGQVNPVQEKPDQVKPKQEKPRQGKPVEEKQPQLNTNISNTDLLNTFLTNQPINQSSLAQNDGAIEGPDIEKEIYDKVREEVKLMINYSYFEYCCHRNDEKFEKDEMTFDEYNEELLTYNIKTVDQVVEYITDVLASTSNQPIKIGHQTVSRKVVQDKLRRCNMLNIKDVVRQLRTTEIKNPKNYAISMLYNS